MLSELCQNCRHATADGCRVNMCAQVRAYRLGTGRNIPKTPVQVSAPEPIAPMGTAYLTVGAAEFPPTESGYIAARAAQGTAEAAGADPGFAYRDRDGLEIKHRIATTKRHDPSPVSKTEEFTPEMIRERAEADTILNEQTKGA